MVIMKTDSERRLAVESIERLFLEVQLARELFGPLYSPASPVSARAEEALGQCTRALGEFLPFLRKMNGERP